MHPAKAALIVGPSWIGDAVMAQCLFQSLKRQSSDLSIDVLAPPHVLPVFRRMPHIRSVIAAPFGHGEFAFARRLSLGISLRGRYSQAYVLPGSWKSALVPWAARIPVRTGYRGEWRYGLLNDIPMVPKPQQRRTASAYQALADLTVLSDPSRLIEPRLTIDPANRDRLLSHWRLSPGRYVCLAPGAEYGVAKRWPARHWITLCAELARRDLKPVLLGGSKDSPITAQIASQAAGAIDLAGHTSLDDAIDLLSACRAAVTNDSGLMHIAAAVGIPVIAIYGSTLPTDAPPLSRQGRSVTLGLACSPCRQRSCPLGHFDCLEKLPPETVLAEMQNLEKP